MSGFWVRTVNSTFIYTVRTTI